jgi:threonine synthase
VNFDAPVRMLNEYIGSVELWHGPSLAFKDFGARFMAALMSYLTSDEDKKITLLTATSGDTGGAVAMGFFDMPGIEVFILYPSGKVSPLQEKQFTTLGGNITVLEISGNFDDCQNLVKMAFTDEDILKKYSLTSANSINMARLIPQTFYYFHAYKQVKHAGLPVVFSVPSGNFGNLTAGLWAKKMGLPVSRFVAATNVNKIIPDYLETGIFQTRDSIHTISHAMDVGNPSNWDRIQNLYNHDLKKIRKDVQGFWLSDEDTIKTIQKVYRQYQYICDPHGAIGYTALESLLKPGELGLFLETAHPAKFLSTMERALGENNPAVPQTLQSLLDMPKKSVSLSVEYPHFKKYLLERA